MVGQSLLKCLNKVGNIYTISAANCMGNTTVYLTKEEVETFYKEFQETKEKDAI